MLEKWLKQLTDDQKSPTKSVNCQSVAAPNNTEENHNLFYFLCHSLTSYSYPANSVNPALRDRLPGWAVRVYIFKLQMGKLQLCHVTTVIIWHPHSLSVSILWSFSFPQTPSSDWPWLMTPVQGVWGEDGDCLLLAGLESSRSHGNAAKGVENDSDWSEGWRWGVLLCCGRCSEAEGTSENWSRCWKEERGIRQKGKKWTGAWTRRQTGRILSRIYKQ